MVFARRSDTREFFRQNPRSWSSAAGTFVRLLLFGGSGRTGDQQPGRRAKSGCESELAPESSCLLIGE
jgi:hypothetical protein